MNCKDRFEKYIIKDGDCWLWSGCKDKDGYGVFYYNGGARRAHRIAFELYKKELTPGLVMCHGCKNKNCVAPEHLEEGTLEKNMQDKWRDNTMPAGEKAYNAKLTQSQVLIIRNSDKSNNDLSTEYNVTAGYIRNIKAGRAWQWLK
jgi:hypothetical protein